MKYYKLVELFAGIFNRTPQVVVGAPCSVGMMPYVNGLGGSEPITSGRFVFVVTGNRRDGQVHLYSVQAKMEVRVRISDFKTFSGWPAPVLAVVHQLLKKEYPLGGFNLMLDDELSLDAGFSSAAISCATVFALNEIFSLNLARREMIHIAQKAEQKFSGIGLEARDMEEVRRLKN